MTRGARLAAPLRLAEFACVEFGSLPPQDEATGKSTLERLLRVARCPSRFPLTDNPLAAILRPPRRDQLFDLHDPSAHHTILGAE